MTEINLLNPKIFGSICRACLGTQNLLPIGEIIWENLRLKNLLQEFLEEEQEIEPKMPPSICKSCSKQFYCFWFYLSKVRKNYSLLKKSLADYKLDLELKTETFEIFDETSKNYTKIELLSENTDQPESDLNSDHNENFNVLNDSDLDDKKSDIVELDFKTLDGVIKDEKTKELINEIQAVKMDIKEIRRKAIVRKKIRPTTKLSNADAIDRPKMDGAYVCVACDTAFAIHKDLIDHKTDTKHKGSIFVCPYCQKKTTNHPRFQIHLRTHTKEKPNKCPQCGKGFNDKGDVQRHVRHVHIGLKKFKCNICNMRFKRKHYLTDHQRKHTNTMSVCHCCGESFQSIYAMYRHMRVHKLQQAKENGTEDLQKDKFKCEICGKCLYSDASLKDHVLLHGPRNFNCEICGKCFTTAKRLKGHKEVSHEDKSNKFKCDECGKVLCTKLIFKAHLLLHKPRSYNCDICGRYYTTAKMLKRHKDVSHEDGKYPCEHCDKVYKQKYVLAQHIDKEHFGTNPSFKCEYCEKDFVYKSSLRMHLRIHTGNTQYQCKECFKICISQRNLNIHMRNHTGEKPYSCSFCDRKFACSSNMKNHERTHTGERMHLCALCPKGFYTSNALKKHMKTHEREKIQNTAPAQEPVSNDNRAEDSMKAAEMRYPFFKVF